MNNSSLLQIALIGNPILRSMTKEVTTITPKIKSFINDMQATLFDVGGMGIAAPQLYKNLRICIIASHPTPRYPHAPYMEPTVLINPIVTFTTKDIIKDWEGCLSVPGIRALVPRYASLSLSYTTVDGKQVSADYEGFIARIIQHEMDHLNGILFLDRLDSTKDIYSEKEFLRIIEARKTKK
jgi:peptide deformylase